MRKLNRLSAVVAAASAGALALVAIPTAAWADYSRPYNCSNNTQVIATYYENAGGRSSEILGDCGTMSVRVTYQTYPGSPTYYTSWVYNSASAYRGSTGNLQLATHHNGTLMNGTSYAILN